MLISFLISEGCYLSGWGRQKRVAAKVLSQPRRLCHLSYGRSLIHSYLSKITEMSFATLNTSYAEMIDFFGTVFPFHFSK